MRESGVSVIGPRTTVLLVDDQPIIVETVRQMLAPEADIEFYFCSDPRLAISAALDAAPTVILQDLVMPDVDGLDLVRDLRAHEGTRHIPLIVLSVKEDPAVKAEAFRRGANDYLVKLPSAIELIARIRYHSVAYVNASQSRLAYEALRESREQLRLRNDEIRRQRDGLSHQAQQLESTNQSLEAANRELESANQELHRAYEEVRLKEQQMAQLNLELAGKNELLAELSTSDSLTGLANRRRLDEAIDEEWRRSIRFGGWLTLILMDIDHFKLYNDALGHLAGDACLRAIGEVLARSARRVGDVAARFGGEEFCILLPGITPEEAAFAAEGVRATIEGLAHPHPGSPVSPIVTVSVGVATANAKAWGESDSLIAAADEALYSAKERGRNRVEVGTLKSRSTDYSTP